MPISDFYIGENKTFTTSSEYNGTIPSSGNVVTLYMKEKLNDADEDALLNVNAGSVSVDTTLEANFSLTPTQLTIDTGTYWLEIKWINSGSNINKVLVLQQIKVKKRVADVD